jgi:hypothetical protein
MLLFLAEISFAQKAFFFKGDFDFAKKEFHIVLDMDGSRTFAAAAQQITENSYRLSLDINHLKTPFFDLLSQIESTIEVQPQGQKNLSTSWEGAGWTGKVWSQYSLVDYKPVRELSGDFEIKDHKVFVHSLSFGNIQCSGTVELGSPYKLDLVFKLYDVAMDDFLNFWGTGKKYKSSGAVSGEIRASGTVNDLALQGSLESRNGFVQNLDYDVIFLNIEGIYPHMKIVRSMIAKSDGVSFNFNGPLNLKDKDNFKKQIKALTLAPLVSDSGSEREWTIRRLNPEASETTEFKYRLRKGDALGTGTSVDDEIDMLGIEQTRKF